MGCGGSKSGDCGCADCSGATAGASLPIGARLATPWTGRSTPGGGATPLDRGLLGHGREYVPIGVRPAVPEPPGFEFPPPPPAYPNPLADIVGGLFASESDLVRAEAERQFRSIAPSLWGDMARYLDTLPSSDRLRELSRIAQSGGTVPIPNVETGVVLRPAGPAGTEVARRVRLRPSGPSSGPGASVPPPPAPQTICLTNGYDPRWGDPPATYLGVAMPFDRVTGYYRFDPLYAIQYSPKDGQGLPKYTPTDLERIRRTYENNSVLRPYRATRASPWEFAWVSPRVPPTVNCLPA